MNLNYNITTIAKAIDCINVVNNAATINTVFIDSRCFFDANTSLFFALRGNKKDGHQFIEELYKKGLRYFVVDDNSRNLPKLKNIVYLKVENTLVALQKLALFHRNNFHLPTIAITGSNGKTSIKEWLYIYLKDFYNIVRSPKSYNSQIGVPLSLLQINSQHTLAIIEAGISQKGEMEKLESMIQPDYGILSKIGTAHLENFSNREELENEKLQLFENVVFFHHYKDNFQKIKKEDESFIIEKTIPHSSYTEIVLRNNQKEFVCKLSFTDKASIENACTCILFLLKFNIPVEHIVCQTEKLPAIAFRLETQKGNNNNTIIRDNYNSNLTSLSIALDYTQRFNQQKKVILLTDLLQDKISTEHLYQEVAKLINQRKPDVFVGIGENMKKFQHLFHHGHFYQNVEDFIQGFNLKKLDNACILIKGTKDFRLDKINRLLVHQTHQTFLEIDLTALLQNIDYYKSKLNPQTRLMCMVKAFGYGSGIREISTILQHHNIDYLGVAYTDEGVELREQGIKIPILVMNPEEVSYEEIIHYQLEPSIYSLHQLENFIHFLIDKNKRSYPVHLKIDTGMHRLGFLEEDVEELIATLNSQPEIYVKGIFSHLAVADEKEEKGFTLAQIEKFKQISNRIETNIGYSTTKHILNSAGIEYFPSFQFDMVRLGIGMYGVYHHPHTIPVHTLKTKISQIKTVKKGEYIGYGKSVRTEEDTIIGIIPIGYADGFSRRLSNGKGSVWIKGRQVPVIGRVSMDMTAINLNKIEGIKEGEEVEIFGKHRPVEDLAKEMNTIPYEVLTSVSARVVRTYYET